MTLASLHSVLTAITSAAKSNGTDFTSSSFFAPSMRPVGKYEISITRCFTTFPSPLLSLSLLSSRSRLTTVILLVARVPVLSVQIMEVQPIVLM